MDIKEILAAKRKRTRTVYVLLDDALAAERDRLIVEASIAERQDEWMSRRPEAPAMKERLRELDDLIAKAQVPFVFQAVPRTRWLELVDDYTDPDDDELMVEGFGPVMIAESSLDPAMTVDDVLAMWDDWSAAETEALYIAAWKVNRETRNIPFTGAGTGTTSTTGSNSTTAPLEE